MKPILATVLQALLLLVALWAIGAMAGVVAVGFCSIAWCH